MQNIFDLMDENIKELKSISIFKKSEYQKTIELIDVNKAFFNEYKERLKDIDTLPYYKKFGTPKEKQNDINFCLDSIIDVKNDLEMLYKKLAEICTFEINKLKK